MNVVQSLALSHEYMEMWAVYVVFQFLWPVSDTTVSSPLNISHCPDYFLQIMKMIWHLLQHFTAK